MAPFATDRDLLALEPTLFRDVLWAGQRLVNGSATIASSVLMMATYDTDLAAAGVGPGNVVLIGGASYEITARLSPTTATVSLLRPGAGNAVIPVGPITSPTAVRIVTFAPQIAIVHAQVMRMLGIEPGVPSSPGSPAETDITNPAALARLETLGALHLIYSAAGALTSTDSPTNQRADLYRQRFSLERERVSAEIDLNADGQPDAVRKINVIQFIRA